MKIETGNCTACGAKNSKFVEKCYKCHAVLPWGSGYRPPAPKPQAAPTQAVTPIAPAAPQHRAAPPHPAAPPPHPAAPPPHPAAPPAFDPLAPPPARTVMYPDSQTPSLPAPSFPGATPPPYQGETAVPPAYPGGTAQFGPMGPLICPTCGYSGHAQTFREGSTITGVLLCLLWLVPGIIYFIWQSSTKYEGCPQCKGRTLVPLHSPQGQFSAGHFYGR